MNSQQPQTLAAIDVGTNSFHLIVAKVMSTGQYRILDREKDIVRLGSGSTDMKYLTPSAMNRGIRALKRMKMIADIFNAPVRAVGTSAIREALNKNEFIRRAKSEAKIKIEIVAGTEEARLIYLGILQALPMFKKKALCIDIGGGSTEYIIGLKQNVLFSNSLKLGAVRLTQRFFPGGSFSSRNLKECRKYVKGTLSPIVRDIDKYQYHAVVGSSGTINSLARIIRSAKDHDEGSSINNYSFTKDELFATVDRIVSARTLSERKNIDGLDVSRADIIAAGAIILEQTFLELSIEEMVVSESALREGILFDSIGKVFSLKTSNYLHDIRMNNIIRLAETFDVEYGHATQVSKLALEIFEKTNYLHHFTDREKEFLEAAALLHETGLFISHAQHHRHSYYLIRNAELPGFTENEKEIIANIARYHRKSHPKLKHEQFQMLSSEEQNVVIKLAAILRIADGLDRTHSAVIRGIECRKYRDHLRFHLLHRKSKNIEMEIWGAERKKELFEQAFHKKINFDQD